MQWFKWMAVPCAAAALVACGGGANEPLHRAMINFGDSLSDVGTYKVGTVNALGGGMYTVNSASAKNWTQVLASQMGLSAPCPYQTGLDGDATQGFSVPVKNNTACKSYAQGGARVTNPVGPGNKALGGSNAILGQLTVPIVTQISNHLATTGTGTFASTDLVTIAAGANDLFINLTAVKEAATGGATAAGAATVAGWDSATVTAMSAGGAAAAGTAATAAVTTMGAAGATLAGYIKNSIVGKGAKYVVVSNMPNVSKTPMALSLDAQSQALIDTMVTTFNSQLKSGLTGVSGVLFVDAYTTSTDQANNPSKYGISVANAPACNLTSPSPNALGSSLVCTTSNLNPGDTSKYLFADTVHPTPFGYELLAKAASDAMKRAGWL